MKRIAAGVFLTLLLSFSVEAHARKKVEYIPPYTQSGFAEVVVQTDSKDSVKENLITILADQNLFIVDDSPNLIFETPSRDASFGQNLALALTKSDLVNQFGNRKALYRLQFNLIKQNGAYRVMGRSYSVLNPGTSIEEAIEISKKSEEMKLLFNTLNTLKANVEPKAAAIPASDVSPLVPAGTVQDAETGISDVKF